MEDCEEESRMLSVFVCLFLLTDLAEVRRAERTGGFTSEARQVPTASA